MGDEDDGDAELALDAEDQLTHPVAQVGVKVGERLVQQQHLGFNDQGPGQRDTLLLTAGELLWASIIR